MKNSIHNLNEDLFHTHVWAKGPGSVSKFSEYPNLKDIVESLSTEPVL